jgi:Flp pilus assembly protein TadD
MDEPRATRRDRPAWPVRRVAVAALALLAVIAVGAWLVVGLRASRDARSARAAVAAGRLDDAEAALERWAQARPSSAEAWLLKAQVAAKRQRPEEALRFLARAESLGSPEEPTARLKGLLLARAGRAAEAEPLLLRALGSSPRPEPELARELTRIYLESYRLEAAASVIQRWLRDAPADPTPYLWQVEIDRRALAEPQVIIAHYRAALERDPRRDEARLGLADALLSAHQNEEAGAAYAEYLERHPDDPAALLGAGINAAQKGDDDTATAYLQRAAALSPNDHRPLAELASIALRRADIEGALALLDQAIGIETEDPELYYRRGVVLARLGRGQDAQKDHEQSARLRAAKARIQELHDRLTRSPGDVQIWYEIAAWLIENGHEEEGLRWAERTVRERPDHAPTHRLLADYYSRRGQTGLANYHQLQATAHAQPRPGSP